MLVMPGTAAMVDNRFEESYDIKDPRENALLGANYLAWLITYSGDIHFVGDYSLPTDPCLINVVILAYNQGPACLTTWTGS